MIKSVFICILVVCQVFSYENNIVKTIIVSDTLGFLDETTASFSSTPPQKYLPVLTVDPNQVFTQTIDGFGAALTESSAVILNSLPKDLRDSLLDQFFNPVSGFGFNYIRVPISASDFSVSFYTYDDLPDGQTDASLGHFSMDHDQQDIIPILKLILKINPQINIMITPWSLPAWMKSPVSLMGTDSKGNPTTLQQQYRSTFANYFLKTIQTFESQGITIASMTLQNEPEFAPSGYPGMLMPADLQLDLINTYLVPVFLKNNIQTKIYLYDHNWNNPDYPISVLKGLSNDGNSIVAGTAFHCYDGDVSAQQELLNQFPNKKILMTECSSGGWATDERNNFVWDTTNLLIKELQYGGSGSMKWNLVLDQNDGPKNGGCQNCHGLIRIDVTKNNQITYFHDFYAFGAFSKYLKSESKRTYSSWVRATDQIIFASFQNPDQSNILFVLNQATYSQPFVIKVNGGYLESYLPGEALGIYRW